MNTLKCYDYVKSHLRVGTTYNGLYDSRASSFSLSLSLCEELHRSQAQGTRGSREGRVVLVRGEGQQIPRGQEARGRIWGSPTPWDGCNENASSANPPRPRSARKKPRSWRRLPRGSPRPADWQIWRRRISLSSLFSLSLFFRIRSLSLSPLSTSRLTLTEIQDVEGVELCGTLKNVVAIAAGFVDGLEMGNNTKAAIMRIGLREMKAFSKMLFSSIEMARGSSKKGAMLPPRPPMR
ncbi:uncharacterized protein [Malus domestica]|uniref:uncharacterized protein n=1 Tax=Malus domestica TaxID=3750 RepID=UPI003976F427